MSATLNRTSAFYGIYSIDSQMQESQAKQEKCEKAEEIPQTELSNSSQIISTVSLPKYNNSFSDNITNDSAEKSFSKLAFAHEFIPIISAEPYLNKLNDNSSGLTEKIISALTIASIPLWPEDTVFWGFVFSVLIIALYKFSTVKGGILGAMKELGKTLGLGIILVWLAGSLDISIGFFFDGYAGNYSRTLLLYFISVIGVCCLVHFVFLICAFFSKDNFIYKSFQENVVEGFFKSIKEKYFK